MGETIVISRERTADRLNFVLNHPEVRPWVADLSEGQLDLTSLVANPNNHVLFGEFGGCAFIQQQPGIYEVHTQTLPGGRGKWIYRHAQACADYMFLRTDCYEILTRVPEGHKGAAHLCAHLGMHHRFTREGECRFRGKVVPVHIWSGTIQDWIGHADWLADRGRWLHGRMAAEARRLGISTPAHEDDPNHNIYVGATYEMAVAGQYAKAITFYNRWALVCRHAPVSLVSVDPPTIRMDIGLLRLIGDDIEVVQPC